MRKSLQKLRMRNQVRERLAKIDERRDFCLVIHYSCESFYDIKDGRTPRVTSIAIRQFSSGQTTSFSIHKSAELLGIAPSQIEREYDVLEKHMLSEYFEFLKSKLEHRFVHWNMRDINYGFQAIEHRFRVLKGEPVSISDHNKIDLARDLISLFGVEYAPHGDSGRMHSLLQLNRITSKDLLNGAGEAEAFEKQEYVTLHQSTLRKVDAIANLLNRTLDGTLITKATWKDIYGIHPAALVEFITAHWIYALVGFVGTLIGIFAIF